MEGSGQFIQRVADEVLCHVVVMNNSMMQEIGLLYFGAPTRNNMTMRQVSQGRAYNTRDVIARVVPERLIFDSNLGMNEIGGDLFKRDRCLKALINCLVEHSPMCVVHLQAVFGQDVG